MDAKLALIKLLKEREHKLKKIEYQKNWYENNKERLKEKNKIRYIKNKEKISIQRKNRYQKNKQKELGWRASVRSQLSEILAKYCKPDWDGEGALPISAEAASVAYNLIDSLPDDVVPPEVTPENSGRISLDWNLGTNRILTISISKESIIFASIVGTRKIHGESTSIYELPQEVKNLLPGYFSRPT